MPALRPYQLTAIQALRERFAAGARRLVLCAPTGAGKTIMFCEIIRSANARSRPALVLAHRGELIDQTIGKLQDLGIDSGVIKAGRRSDSYLPVQVASIQTLARRMDRLPPADLIVYDEAHHSTSPTSRRILEAYPGAVVIGATATPWRIDRLGLADLYEGHVLAATPAELIEQGHLVPYDLFAYDAPDLHSVRVTAGEFNQRDLGLACNTSVLVGNAVREYLEHAAGRSAIVFPVNVEHSRALVEEFQSSGISADHVDCHTPTAKRDAMLAAFRAGRLTVVSSVGVLTEGFDAPTAEVCILCRPTKSLGLYIQMVGRVLRPSPSTGKRRALIHDHAGCALRHGLPDDDRSYELTATPARVVELSTCPYCHLLVGRARADGTCKNCGGLIAPVCQLCSVVPCKCPRSARSAPEQVAGTRIDVEEIRRRRGDLSDRQLTKIATATRRQRAAEYLRLVELCKRKGWGSSWVTRAYADTFGEFPRFSEEELIWVQPAKSPFVPPARRSA